MRFIFASILLAGLLTGCVTTPQTTMLGPARPTIRNAAGVKIYQVPPKRFEEIALVEGRSIEELRSRAGAVGANGLIPGGARRGGPVIGVGLGTGTYHYGRHSAYGFETGTSFGVPTGGTILQGTAIYVP